MPDQSTAAAEHEILQQLAVPLARLPDDPMAIAAGASFPVALRGYERGAVDAYVRKTSQLVAELHATHSPEIAVRRALERVGEEVAGVLRRAHDTAEEITAQSRRDADDRLQSAHREAEQIVAAARDRLRLLDRDTDGIWEDRRRIVEDMRELAEELLSVADSAIERLAFEGPESQARPVEADSEARPAQPTCGMPSDAAHPAE